MDHKLRFAIYDGNSILNETQFIDHDSLIKRTNVNITSSVYTFPTLNIDTKDQDLAALLKNYDRDHKIILYLEERNGERVFFKGTFQSININYDKENGYHIISKSVHSLYLFQKFIIKHIEINNNNETPEKFLLRLGKLLNVNIDIVESKTSNYILPKTECNNINAFKLIKNICLMNGLILNLGLENTIEFIKHNDLIERMRNGEPVATLTEKDILSMEYKK